MADIQVDMFEVQLGASLLLQFGLEGSTVRVLADAGTSGGGYPPDHVLAKLQRVLPTADGASARIDLLVGTHYDADHLNQMVPIIDAYEFGEAWLPPVANDTDEPAADWDEPRPGDFLAAQFARDDGARRLSRYLSIKAGQLNEVRELRSMVEGAQRDADLDPVRLRSMTRAGASAEVPALDVDDAFFADHLADAVAFLGARDEHASEDVRPPRAAADIEPAASRSPVRLSRRPPNPRAAALSLAYLQRGTAKDAMNAKALFKVVEALKRRGVPMRFEMVADGQPALFQWHAGHRRFRRSARRDEARLGLTLLGPSQALVHKHWERLPQGSYRAFALAQPIAVEDITPSNQLSYGMLFAHRGQRLLVAGDTGFVDFIPLGSRGNQRVFYPDLIAALREPIQVVQVAHHAGHNKYFYHALIEAGFARQDGISYLLLSHATGDKSRPSKAFSDFADMLLSEGSKARLLFTARPRREAVAAFREMAAVPVPRSTDDDRGDVRLVYGSGRWRVQRHAISI